MKNKNTVRERLKEAYLELNHLEEQAATFGKLYTPSYLPIQIEEKKKRIAELEDLIEKLSQDQLDCPYRGLFAFREMDACFFFGRELFVNRLCHSLQNKPIVVITGSSGSGKSSVVYAGLIPRLKESEGWSIVSFRPGEHPFQSLIAALTPYIEDKQSSPEKTEETTYFTINPEHGIKNLSNELYNILDLERNPQKRLLLIADQFEELFTLCKNEIERDQFIYTLLTIFNPNTNDHEIRPLRLVLTLRADFFDAALKSPLADVLQTDQQILKAMKLDDLRKVIEEPARQLWVEIEPGLTDQILEAIIKQPGDLPLLEFALTELWVHQQEGKLTKASYHEIGGVVDALTRYANEQFYKLKQEDQVKARQVMIQLVQPGTQDTRRVAIRSEIGNSNWEIVKLLTKSRLIVMGYDERSQQETVEVVHEALIDRWELFKEWMKEDRDFRAWQELLRRALYQWENSNQDLEALVGGRLLQQSEEWLYKRSAELSAKEKDFIQNSLDFKRKKELDIQGVKVKQADLTVQSQFLWRFLGGILAGASLFLIYGILDAIYIAKYGNSTKFLLHLPILNSLDNLSFFFPILLPIPLAFGINRALIYSNHKENVINAKPFVSKRFIISFFINFLIWVIFSIIYITNPLIVGDVWLFSILPKLAWVILFIRLILVSPSFAVYLTQNEDTSDLRFIETAKKNNRRLWILQLSGFFLLLTLLGVYIWAIPNLVLNLNQISNHPQLSDDLLYQFIWPIIIGIILMAELWQIKKIAAVWTLEFFAYIIILLISLNWLGIMARGNIVSSSSDNLLELLSFIGLLIIVIVSSLVVILVGLIKIKNWHPRSKPIKSYEYTETMKHSGPLQLEFPLPQAQSLVKKLKFKKATWLRIGYITFSIFVLIITLTLLSLGGSIYSSHTSSIIAQAEISSDWYGTDLRLIWAPTGDLLAFSEGKTIHIVDSDGKLIRNLEQSSDIANISWSPNNNILAVIDENKTLWLWNLQTYTEIIQLPDIGTIGWSPDGKMFATGGKLNELQLWNAEGKSVTSISGLYGTPYSIKWSGDGSKIATASDDKPSVVRLWDVNQRKVLKIMSIYGYSKLSLLEWSLDSKVLAFNSLSKLFLWNDKGEIIAIVPLDTYIDYIAWSSKNDLSVTTGKTLFLFDSGGLQLTTLTPGYKSVWSPSGDILASVGEYNDNTIRLWQIDKSQNNQPNVLNILSGYSDPVTELSWSPKGDKLAAGFRYGAVRIWKINS